jgi:hypothetical protein
MYTFPDEKHPVLGLTDLKGIRVTIAHRAPHSNAKILVTVKQTSSKNAMGEWQQYLKCVISLSIKC